MATSDSNVCEAMLHENCSKTIVSLFVSEKPELVHRALVVINQFCTNGGQKYCMHLIEGGVIPAMAVVARIGDPSLVDLCKDCVMLLNTLTKEVP